MIIIFGVKIIGMAEIDLIKNGSVYLNGNFHYFSKVFIKFWKMLVLNINLNINNMSLWNRYIFHLFRDRKFVCNLYSNLIIYRKIW